MCVSVCVCVCVWCLMCPLPPSAVPRSDSTPASEQRPASRTGPIKPAHFFQRVSALSKSEALTVFIHLRLLLTSSHSVCRTGIGDTTWNRWCAKRRASTSTGKADGASADEMHPRVYREAFREHGSMNTTGAGAGDPLATRLLSRLKGFTVVIDNSRTRPSLACSGGRGVPGV